MPLAPLTFSGHLRSVLTLGLPLIGGHLAQFAIGLTDTLMIGWYGVPELAALTLAHSFLFTLFLFGAGFGWAVMPMVATFAARGQEVMVRRATRMALWLSILYFVLVMPLAWFSAPMLRALGQSDEIAQMAQTYLRIAGWGMLPALGVMVLKNYLAGLEHTRIVLWITLAAAVANVIANYALIFGNWGAPELGIAGAAIASVLSHLTSLVFVILYAVRKLPEHQIFVRFWRPDVEMFSQVARLGIPIGVTTLAEVMLFAGSAVLMGALGVIPLAAHGIAIQVSTATFMIQMGLSNAATVRAGTALGHADAGHLAEGARAVLVLGMAAVSAAMLLFLSLPEPLIGLFLDPSEPDRAAIIETGRVLLIMAALFQAADGLQVIHIGLLRGLQDTRVPMLMAALAYWGIGMPAAWALGLPLGFGGVGVWAGLTLGLAVAAVLLAWRFWSRAVPGLARIRPGEPVPGLDAPFARD
ncbi:MATE family efflux transporter [Citreimonas salinaria]|uniref:Multidrug-efflux transporter n=1 Tax=Citreimonas salinaria TaxID=321339 RepID=A0A1H3HBP6_9RHOB|nr:MATE family efflux transporter [Citreimonas salinaria]SDY12298.1 multidrug resistance protein, MATE family [Citreimonas salinaria]